MAAPDLNLLQRMLADQRKQNAELKHRLEGGGNPPHDGGMETRVAQLETAVGYLTREMQALREDVRTGFRDVRTDMRTDFRLLGGGIIAVALGLAGLMAKGFGWL